MQTYTDNKTLSPETVSKLLLHLNISLSSHNDFSENITQALKTIGELSGHDKIHIIEILQDMTFKVQYEWHNQNIESTPHKSKQSKIIHHTPLEQQLHQQNYIIVRQEGNTNAELQTLLQEQHCVQMLLLPLFESDSQFSFIAFQQCKKTHEWQKEEIQILTNISSAIAKQLNNYQLVNRLSSRIDKLKKKNEMQQYALEARNRLYAVIAHDLRAPIGTLKMINSSIENQKDKIKNSAILKLFTMLYETTEEAFNLLENLLQWSQHQNGKTNINASNFNIKEIVREVSLLFNTIAKTKTISLNNHVDKDCFCYADKDLIKTVLRNLLSNAVKFTFLKGQIDISLSQLPTHVLVSIKDNGQGISKEIQKKLLKSNEYVTTYGTHNEKGNGLGLELCHDFINMSNGKFWFTSEEGKGSTFFFTLPYSHTEN